MIKLFSLTDGPRSSAQAATCARLPGKPEGLEVPAFQALPAAAAAAYLYDMHSPTQASAAAAAAQPGVSQVGNWTVSLLRSVSKFSH